MYNCLIGLIGVKLCCLKLVGLKLCCLVVNWLGVVNWLN